MVVEQNAAQLYNGILPSTERNEVFIHMLGFPVDSDSKDSTCNEGDLGSIPRLGRFPGGGHGNPLQYSCLEYPHEQRSMVDYCPRGRKKSDAIGLLSTALIHVMT